MKRIVVIMIASLVAFSAAAGEAVCIGQDMSAQIFKKSKGEIKEVVFNVDLHCNNCVKKVQENIAFEKGVKGLDVSLEKQTVAVRFDASKTSADALKAALQKLGIKVKTVEYPKEK